MICRIVPQVTLCFMGGYRSRYKRFFCLYRSLMRSACENKASITLSSLSH